jgi:excinuclease UvrABC nuclease subunit
MDLISIVPICYYLNADIQKEQIIKDNIKTGIYRWINVVYGKSYVGFSMNLSIRFKNYFNITFKNLMMI